jgi:hypothetical protein
MSNHDWSQLPWWWTYVFAAGAGFGFGLVAMVAAIFLADVTGLMIVRWEYI